MMALDHWLGNGHVFGLPQRPASRLWRFIVSCWFELNRYLVRPRWFIVPPIILFIAFTRVAALISVSKATFLQANIWDSLLIIFTDVHLSFYILNIVMLFLISDFHPSSPFQESVLLRVNSRMDWWISKLLALGIAVGCYIVLSVGIVAGVTSFVLPIQTIWSELAIRAGSDYLGLATLNMTPTQAFARTMLLLGLGWYTLGLLAHVISDVSDHPAFGILTALALNFSGLFAADYGVQPPLSYISIHYHLFLNNQSFGTLTPLSIPMIWSLVYWTCLIALLVAAGSWHTHHRDFLTSPGAGE